MKNVSIFFGCVFFLLTSCSLKKTKIFDDDQFNILWRPIISLLITDPGLQRHLSHPGLITDLLFVTNEDSKKLTSLWQQMPKIGLSKQELQKNENLFFHQGYEKFNDEVISGLDRSKIMSHPNKNYRSIAQKVINSIESHPLSSSKNVSAHRFGEQIGFCFARAMLAHYLLLKNGVPQHDISKIFIVGDMKVGQQFWHFHIAMMVEDSEYDFLVVDPTNNLPLDYKDWMAICRRYSIKYPLSRLRFFVTDPRKFLPASGMYDVDSLSNPVFKDYFYQLGLAIKEKNADYSLMRD